MKRLLALTVLVVMQSIAPALVSGQDNRGSSQASDRRSTPTRSVRTANRPGQQPQRAAQGVQQSNRGVQPASHSQIIYDDAIVSGEEYGGYGETIVDGSEFSVGEVMMDGGCDSCGGGGCSGCQVGGGLCNSCNSPRRFCLCFPSHGWVQAESLLWYQSGMVVPTLVTTSPTGTSRANAGVLGRNTSTLFGDDDLLTEEGSGFRIRFGWWLATFPGWGVEGEYVGLSEQTESFSAGSSGAAGSTILARPFFNATTGSQASELIAFPGVVSGNIAVDVTSKLDGSAFRLRRQLSCTSGSAYSPISCQMVPTSSRLDATVGYRFWQLSESLQVREQLTSMLSTDPGSFDITDRFETRNQFNGTELGFVWQGRRGFWSLDALMRVAIGNVHQTVTVSGDSAITQGAAPGVTVNSPGGIYAVSSNIGTYDRDKFTMVPELGLTVGYQMTKRVRLTTGYSLVYWGNVVRPGDQIDTVLNPNLFPPQETAVSSPNRPQFEFNETDYYVQGLSFGGEFRW